LHVALQDLPVYKIIIRLACKGLRRDVTLRVLRHEGSKALARFMHVMARNFACLAGRHYAGAV
jgi:hypothetical protein